MRTLIETISTTKGVKIMQPRDLQLRKSLNFYCVILLGQTVKQP